MKPEKQVETFLNSKGHHEFNGVVVLLYNDAVDLLTDFADKSNTEYLNLFIEFIGDNYGIEIPDYVIKQWKYKVTP